MSLGLRLFFSVVVTVIVVAIVAGALLWWKLATLKENLIGDLSNKLGAQVTVQSIGFDFWKGELHAAGITLVNQRPSSPWEKGEIAQATVHYQLADIFAPSIPLEVEVSSWSMTLRSPLRTAEAPPAPESAPSNPPDHAPGRLHVAHLIAQEGSVEFDFSDDRKITAQGVSFDAQDNGSGIWTTQVQASSIKSDQLNADAASVQLRSESGQITMSDLRLQVGQGLITGDGTVALDAPHAAKINLTVARVPTWMLLGLAWRMKVTGDLDGTLTYQGDDTSGAATGQVSVAHGKFNVLPALGKMAQMIGLPDWSNVEVDKATSDIAWKDGALHLTNIDIRKTDVVRAAGTVDVDAQGQIDGRLQLGLPNTILAPFPQVAAAVFPVQRDDCAWTDVHLTGTADHLQEDLTPRLMAAGLHQGGDLLNQGVQNAGSLLQNLLGK
jgi:hypothetical protein